MHNIGAITIFEYELKLQEYDLRQVRKVKSGGEVSLVTLQRSSDSQDKLISALLEMNSDAIYTHTHTHKYRHT